MSEVGKFMQQRRILCNCSVCPYSSTYCYKRETITARDDSEFIYIEDEDIIAGKNCLCDYKYQRPSHCTPPHDNVN